jgi:hypothetical protein
MDYDAGLTAPAVGRADRHRLQRFPRASADRSTSKRSRSARGPQGSAEDDAVYGRRGLDKSGRGTTQAPVLRINAPPLTHDAALQPDATLEAEVSIAGPADGSGINDQFLRRVLPRSALSHEEGRAEMLCLDYTPCTNVRP